MRGVVVVVVVVVVGAVYKALAMGEEMANMASSVRKAANRDTPMRCRRRCWWACPSTW
jgi:Sec-independent protein translocase protein TatA